MNLDDESFLSAYLDGELDLADRLAVEWAVESSPALAEQLRELGQARAAVVHLGRPRPPRDLAPAIVGRLVAARRRAQLRDLIRPGKVVLAASGVLGMAASLFLALIVLHHSTHDVAHPGLFASWFAPAPAVRTHPIIDIDIRPTPTPKPTRAANPRLIAQNPAERGPGPVRPSPPVRRLAEPRTAEDLLESKDRARLAGMVGGPHPVVRALLVADSADQSDRVHAWLQADARKVPDFGRITIDQGLVVDPAWPGPADVYPVVLDERGCPPFLDRLKAAFPGLKVERDVTPELLTQLPEVGVVAFFRGVEAAPLGIPPGELRPLIANKNLSPRSHFGELTTPDPADIDPPGPRSPSGPGRGREATGPRDEAGGESSDPGPEDRGNVTVLIWVTRPGR